jgi:FlaA1/EpsC-like NDP-sugar epimerase
VSAVEKYQIDEIILAIPSASKAELREIINISKQTSCQIKTVPGIYEFIDGNIDINSLRNIQIEDLLGRDPIDLDTREMGHFVYVKSFWSRWWRVRSDPRSFACWHRSAPS